MASTNPHYDSLTAIATALAAAPAISNLPTPDVRELPFVLGSDEPPLCFVCPGRRGRRLMKRSFQQTHVDYPCVVLLIHAGNSTMATGLQSRLKLGFDVMQRLYVPAFAGIEAYDIDADPQAAADVQASLGTNYIVSGVGLSLRWAHERAVAANHSDPARVDN